jgi:hypothetical protein
MRDLLQLADCFVLLESYMEERELACSPASYKGTDPIHYLLSHELIASLTLPPTTVGARVAHCLSLFPTMPFLIIITCFWKCIIYWSRIPRSHSGNWNEWSCGHLNHVKGKGKKSPLPTRGGSHHSPWLQVTLTSRLCGLQIFIFSDLERKSDF